MSPKNTLLFRGVFAFTLLVNLPFSNAAVQDSKKGEIDSLADKTSALYKIFVQDEKVGWERFNITNKGDVQALSTVSEIQTPQGPKRVTSETDTRNGALVRYSVETSTGKVAKDIQKYFVDFENNEARVTLESGGRTGQRVVPLHEDTLVLDKDVWQQVRFIVARYRNKNERHFHVFIPRPALRELDASISFVDSYSVKYGKIKTWAYHFAIKIEQGFQIDVETDASGFPLAILAPSEGLRLVIDQ